MPPTGVGSSDSGKLKATSGTTGSFMARGRMRAAIALLLVSRKDLYEHIRSAIEMNLREAGRRDLASANTCHGARHSGQPG